MENKTDNINIRLTNKEKELLREKAKKLGMTSSQYVRFMLLYKQNRQKEGNSKDDR